MARYLADLLGPATGYDLKVRPYTASVQGICLHLNPSQSALGPEAYDLQVTPQAVTYALSLDGKTFTQCATIKNDVSPHAPQPQTKDFTANIAPTQARYIKVVGQSLGVCPPWPAGAGGKCCLFADEIVVE